MVSKKRSIAEWYHRTEVKLNKSKMSWQNRTEQKQNGLVQVTEQKEQNQTRIK